MENGERAGEACNPVEVGLKSFFLGPQAENSPWLAGLFQEILGHWFRWRQGIFPDDGAAISNSDRQLDLFQSNQRNVHDKALALLKRYEAEVPKFSPRYIGHMFSEISMPALLGHVISLLHNPNIIASEAARVGVQIENEAIEALFRMVGFDPEYGLGHFTSGGTAANYESVLRARERTGLWMARGLCLGEKSYFKAAHMGWQAFNSAPICQDESKLNYARANPWKLADDLRIMTDRAFQGPVLMFPRSKHYSWLKSAHLVGLGDDSCWQIALDDRGKMSIPALRAALSQAERDDRPVLMVVSVAGTTELGEVDSIDRVQEVLDEWRDTKGIHIWHHVDAAYGGFFRTVALPDDEGMAPEVWRSLQAMSLVDSITIDPHKLGYVPYSSGAILVQDRQDYMITAHDAPYIRYRSIHDRGKFTLEGSRSAGGATATWLAAETIGFHQSGYGLILARTILIRRRLEAELEASGLPVCIAPGSDTNILCFHAARKNEPLSLTNKRTESLYNSFTGDGKNKFFVSKTVLFWTDYEAYLNRMTNRWTATVDEQRLVMIRLCIMNPFFDSKEMNTDFYRAWLDSLRTNLELVMSEHPQK
jgi:glutamate/tyrosine decarboxylase-like PLP-dependent enzyme